MLFSHSKLKCIIFDAKHLLFRIRLYSHITSLNSSSAELNPLSSFCIQHFLWAQSSNLSQHPSTTSRFRLDHLPDSCWPLYPHFLNEKSISLFSQWHHLLQLSLAKLNAVSYVSGHFLILLSHVDNLQLFFCYCLFLQPWLLLLSPFFILLGLSAQPPFLFIFVFLPNLYLSVLGIFLTLSRDSHVPEVIIFNSFHHINQDFLNYLLRLVCEWLELYLVDRLVWFHDGIEIGLDKKEVTSFWEISWFITIDGR